MTNEYYPFSDVTCHHFNDNNGCTFCGYKYQKRSVSEKPVSLVEQIEHFDKFVLSNIDDICKRDRLIIAPNGSWFTQITKELRRHIYQFIENEKISFIQYESRATLFDISKARTELSINFRGDELESKVCELKESIDEINATHIVSLGLEVANDYDLKKINKGAILEDYINASREILNRNGILCCNILIAPPKVDDPIYKALFTAKYAVETLGAKELLVMSCIPMKHTKAYELWKLGEWNPINATAASEILHIIREKHPSVNVKFKDLRVYSFHGRYGEFFRENRQWSDEEKLLERKKVRDISKKVYYL